MKHWMRDEVILYFENVFIFLQINFDNVPFQTFLISQILQHPPLFGIPSHFIDFSVSLPL